MADHVAVCIPTYKRPRSLQRLLEAIARLKTDARITVIVADNDAEGHAGRDLCAALKDYRWPLQAVIAEKRGIAQVRNRLIEQALTTDAGFIGRGLNGGSSVFTCIFMGLFLLTTNHTSRPLFGVISPSRRYNVRSAKGCA